MRSVALPLLAAAVIVSLVGCGSTASPSPQLAERAKVQAYVSSALDFMGANGLYVKKASWARTREQTVAKTRNDTTYQQAYGALMLAAWAAGGPKHSAFRSPTGIRAVITAYGEGTTRPSAHPVAPNIATVVLPEFAGGITAQIQSYADTGAKLIQDLAPTATCGWVVDLRKDYGGNMMPMLTSVSALLSQGDLVSFVDRHKKATWTRLSGSTITYEADTNSQREDLTAPTSGSTLAGRPIAVLQGEFTGSSGEATLLAFHGQSGVRTFGQTSAGVATANIGKTMSDRANVLITTAMMTDRHGHAFPNGIPPDQVVAAPAGNGTNSDPTMDAAVNWLQQACIT